MDFKRKLWKASARMTTVVVSYLFVLLFLYAAISKILDIKNFGYQLAQSPLLSAYTNEIVWSLPSVEIIIAIFLMIPQFRRLALYASFGLMVMFTTYIFIVLNFSDFIPCSCGGVLEAMNWTQHFIFNSCFIALAGAAIIYSKPKTTKKKLKVLAMLSIFAVGVVTVLFLFSEKKMHRNNAFQRRFVPHPIKLIQATDLSFNSYYIAGIKDGLIYLGNVTAPLNILVVDTNFTIKKKYRIQLDEMDLPYQRIHIDVRPPIFYVSDGTVPIILKGSTANWEAHTLLKHQFYFSSFVPFSEDRFIFKTIDGKTKKQVLANYTLSTQNLNKNFNLLDTQRNRVFDTDGQLLSGAALNKLVYVYYYRNQYVVFDQELGLDFLGKTIDTISQAQLELIHNPQSNETKLSGTSVVVNKQASLSGDYLYIISDRLGNYEDDSSLDKATIVDVYKLSEKTYEFSFYIYDYKKFKVSQLQIEDKYLYAMMGNYLVRYKLNEKYFNDK